MLKSCCVFLSVLLVVVLFGTQTLKFEGVGDSYCFYVGDDSSCCQIINVEVKNAEKIKRSLDGISGESFKTKKLSDVDKVIEDYDAKLQFSEQIGETTINYYYTDKLSYFKRIKGKKVNLQTARSNEVYTVGTPLIFGSF